MHAESMVTLRFLLVVRQSLWIFWTNIISWGLLPVYIKLESLSIALFPNRVSPLRGTYKSLVDIGVAGFNSLDSLFLKESLKQKNSVPTKLVSELQIKWRLNCDDTIRFKKHTLHYPFGNCHEEYNPFSTF